MRTPRLGIALVSLALMASTAAAQPSAAQFTQLLEAHLQKLKPAGTTVRTVLFQDVQPGKPNGGYYPFQVTAIIHDYGPGYPSNHYYGQTCVGKMDKWKFDALKDDFGKWIVQGRMTVSDAVCKNNPSEGVSSMPVAGLAGEAAPRAAPVGAQPTTPAVKEQGSLYIGEYACYGVHTKLMAGMGFRLKTGGTYDDLDGKRGGAYIYDAAAATITFRGGFLGGQAGKHVRMKGFDLSATVNCEPWR